MGVVACSRRVERAWIARKEALRGEEHLGTSLRASLRRLSDAVHRKRPWNERKESAIRPTSVHPRILNVLPCEVEFIPQELFGPSYSISCTLLGRPHST